MKYPTSAPGSIALYAFPMNMIWSFSVYPVTMALPLYSSPRSSMRLFPVSGVRVDPAPSLAFPYHPSVYSSLSSTSMTFSLSSSVTMPEPPASSFVLSMTLIFSTIFAGRFFNAAVGSLKKKVLPPTVILSIFSPFNVTVPSSATSMPGIFLIRSSSMAFSLTLNDAALNSMVSFFTTMGLPIADTVDASRNSAFSSIFITPRSYASQ